VIRVVYLDSSAITKLLVADETERLDLRSYLSSRPDRAASVVARVEVARALSRRDAAHDRELRNVWAGVSSIPLDRTVIERASIIEPPRLRTLDAIHLASAMELGGDLDALVTYDVKLAAAARAAGLPVESPGKDH
jgi:predicted nucleic acid-binding protein